MVGCYFSVMPRPSPSSLVTLCFLLQTIIIVLYMRYTGSKTVVSLLQQRLPSVFALFVCACVRVCAHVRVLGSCASMYDVHLYTYIEVVEFLLYSQVVYLKMTSHFI